jgi:serine/threonine protein kinase/Tol biopolymer transport system component
MALTAGTILGQYEIRSPLGAGGMGEVYRASDTRLDRDVVIKVLPDYLTSDPERLRRFEQEARATAALNHPNILAVYQMATDKGISYLVEELLEGETLRERLRHGPIPLRKAIDYGVQIAHGLSAAHDRGIVHRDLKPENLFVTKDGRVKILDFGLARLGAFTQSSGEEATVEQKTDPGVVLGTAGYMSPEQVRGKTVDHRTDIFAFGTILYEVVTGKQPFRKPTSADTMAAILNEEPSSISQAAPATPPGLQRVVHRCLEKGPEQRFHSAHDLAFALEALSDSGASPAAVTQTPSRRSLRRTLVWSIVPIAVILLAAAAWFAVANRKSGPPLRISEYTQLTHNGIAGYVAGSDGSRLYLTQLGGPIDQVAVSGGDIEKVASITLPGPLLVDVSPDGSTLLVQSFRPEMPSVPLYALHVLGGAHRYLADAAIGGGTWSPDGKYVAYSTSESDIDIVNSDGTGTRKLASVGASVRGAAQLLNWSPDGSTIRFSRDLKSLWEITSSGSKLHQLLTNWHPSEVKCCGRWSPDGRFYVFLAGRLEPWTYPQAQIYALDERRGLFRRPADEPVRLTFGPSEWSPPVFSKDGKKIFATGSTRRGELVRLDPRSGQFQPFLGGISADLITYPKDGQSVAYVTYPDGILWRANQDGSDHIQLTSPPLSPHSLAWSPDGTRIVFAVQSPQGLKAWIVPSRGGSPQQLLPEDSGEQADPSWSPDGRKIIFSTGELGSSESHVRILDLASHQISTLPGSDSKFKPRWSPGGQFISASSVDVSTINVFDINTQHWSALKVGIHDYPMWSRDGRSIYFFRYEENRAILRIPSTGGEAKLVVSLKDFPSIGTNGIWFGLDPTDAPLMLRDVSTTDVYALTLEEK